MRKIVFLIFILGSLSLYSATFTGFRSVLANEQAEEFYPDDSQEKSVVVFSSIIDWNEQKVKVSAKTKINLSTADGETIKNTFLALKSLCLKKAAESIDDINIDCKSKVKEFKEKNSDFNTKFQKFLTDVSVYDFDKSYKTTGIVTCQLSIPIAGSSSLTSILAENYLPFYFNYNIPAIHGLFTQTLYADESTGIIIDARNIKINPAVFPKVTTEKKDVYNPKTINKKDLAENGAVQYAVVGSKVDEKTIKTESLKQSLAALKRTGVNPVIIKAYKTDGPLQTDAVISEKDASNLKNNRALKEGKVTIIVDASVGGTIGMKVGDYDILLLSCGD